jgi:hypothetical protein
MRTMQEARGANSHHLVTRLRTGVLLLGFFALGFAVRMALPSPATHTPPSFRSNIAVTHSTLPAPYLYPAQEGGYLSGNRRLCENAVVPLLDSSVKEGVERRAEWASHLGYQYLGEKYDKNGWEASTVPHSHVRFDALGPVDATCGKHMRAFGSGDEEKRMCWSDAHATVEPCVVFSFGGNNLWDFEGAVVANTRCDVVQFDCFVKGHVPKHLASRVKFYSACVGNRNYTDSDGRKFYDLQGINELVGRTKGPTYMKMDIEGSEWDVMSSVFNMPEAQMPQQIAMELHYQTEMPLPWKHRLKTIEEILLLMNALFQKAGFLLVDRHDNERCPHCAEIVLAKAVCGL